VSFCERKRLGSDFALSTELAASLGASQDALTVLVKLELVDDNIGGVDADRDGLARGLVTSDALDVNHVLETVHRGDLALTTLVGATDNGDLVVLADGDAADLFAQFVSAGALKVARDPISQTDVRCTARGAPCSGERS
jgi:hypothetical protein